MKNYDDHIFHIYCPQRSQGVVVRAVVFVARGPGFDSSSLLMFYLFGCKVGPASISISIDSISDTSKNEAIKAAKRTLLVPDWLLHDRSDITLF